MRCFENRRRRKVAGRCAVACNDQMMAIFRQMLEHTLTTNTQPPPELEVKARFWMRNAIRYNRIRLNKSPWKNPYPTPPNGV